MKGDNAASHVIIGSLVYILVLHTIRNYHYFDGYLSTHNIVCGGAFNRDNRSGIFHEEDSEYNYDSDYPEERVSSRLP